MTQMAGSLASDVVSATGRLDIARTRTYMYMDGQLRNFVRLSPDVVPAILVIAVAMLH